LLVDSRTDAPCGGPSSNLCLVDSITTCRVNDVSLTCCFVVISVEFRCLMFILCVCEGFPRYCGIVHMVAQQRGLSYGRFYPDPLQFTNHPSSHCCVVSDTNSIAKQTTESISGRLITKRLKLEKKWNMNQCALIVQWTQARRPFQPPHHPTPPQCYKQTPLCNLATIDAVMLRIAVQATCCGSLVLSPAKQ
jgi:hypothetical protein